MSGFIEHVDDADHAAVKAALRQDPALAHASADDGRSALRIALDREDERMARLLMDWGADPDPFDCVLLGDIERLKWYVAQDAARIDARDAHGWTCLHLAATEGRTGILRWLLRHGCNSGGRTEDGAFASALHLAAARGQARCADALCTADPDLLRARDAAGRTALHVAAAHGHDDVAALLLEHGADTRLPNAFGAVPSESASS